jgi:hypothetical protein
MARAADNPNNARPGAGGARRCAARRAYWAAMRGGALKAIQDALGPDALARLSAVRVENAIHRIAVVAALDEFVGPQTQRRLRPGKSSAFMQLAQGAGWGVNERTLRNWRQRVGAHGIAGLLRDNRGRGRRRLSIDSKLWLSYRRLRDAGMSRPRARALVAQAAQAAGRWFPSTVTLRCWRRDGIVPQLRMEGGVA